MNHMISIQWHITTKCQNRCKHCYMFVPETYMREQARCLSLDKKLQIIEQLDCFGEKWGFAFPTVTLLGGDPLLAEDVFPFIEALDKKGKKVALGGNPDCLTDENLKKLKDLNISYYQLSLDGLETTHDLIRKKDSFKNTLEGYEKLDKYEINSFSMTTLTPLNIDEFFELIDFVFFKTRSKGFAFDFVSRVGNGKEFDISFTPQQALAISNRYLELKEKYKEIRPEFTFIEKPGMMRLLHMERGDLIALDEGNTSFYSGCLIGNRSISILSDGTILSCRRFPEILGRLPEDSIEDIMLSNETLKKYRRPQFYEACGDCIGWNYCRGCAAQSYGESKYPFKKPSICYAHLLSIPTKQKHAPIPMDTTKKEEADLIRNNLPLRFYSALQSSSLSSESVKAMTELLCDDTKLAFFRLNPLDWLKDKYPNLSAQDRDMVVFHVNNPF